MANPKPLLIVSDAISASSGLARITRDLSTRIHENLSDVYRVATAGNGGPGSSKFGFQQYVFERIDNWVLPGLQQVWEDFAGDEPGIIMFIWDPSRVTWFSQPLQFGELLARYPSLQQWLLTAKIEKWLYAPIDAEGPNQKLTFPLAKTFEGFDRILTYGNWAASVVSRTLGKEEAAKRHLSCLPHGIDPSVFFQYPRKVCRKLFMSRLGVFQPNEQTPAPIADDEVLIGIVATNQNRKDWALGIETVALLKNDMNIRLWIHTDELERYWSIAALLIDFGLLDRTVVSLGYLPDERMAEAYSACDVTLGIGLGEGMGYPIFESEFCGTPCVHGNYGGAPEWMKDQTALVDPVAYRYDGLYSSVRPVFAAKDWAAKVTEVVGKRITHNGDLDWVNLWPHWESYLREAAE